MSNESIAINVLLDRLVSELAAHQRECDVSDKLRAELYTTQEYIGTLMTQIADLKQDLASSNNEVVNLREKIARLKGALPDATHSSTPVNQEYIHSSPANVSALIEAVKSGRKIESIKMVRTITGMGLKEAKDLFEAAYGEPF
jgi:ribosomal protein L7/L12